MANATTPESLERKRQYERRRYAENRETRRAQQNAGRAVLKREVIEGYGGACVCCGTTLLVHLTIDHIDGGGRRERLTNGGAGVYRRLRREGFPSGYQVLCFNCNSAKHMLGRCPCQDGEG